MKCMEERRELDSCPSQQNSPERGKRGEKKNFYYLEVGYTIYGQLDIHCVKIGHRNVYVRGE